MHSLVLAIGAALSLATAAPHPQPEEGLVKRSYSGDMTYYAAGLGSCGYHNTGSQKVVALSTALMKTKAHCGKTITIHYGGKTHTAKVVDTCGGCSTGSIDASTSLFEEFAPLSQGRLHGVTWSFN